MVMAAIAGAKEDFTAEAAQEKAAYEARVTEEKAFFSHSEQIEKATDKDLAKNPLVTLAKVVAIGSLISCGALAVWVFAAGPDALEQFQQWLVLPTILYFISGTYWFTKKESAETDETEYYSQQPEVESRG